MNYIIAGHSNVRGKNYDPGASGMDLKGVIHTEADLTRELRDLITQELIAQGCQVRNEESSFNLTQTMNWLFARSTEKDKVVDIHFNAATAKEATGVECFVSDPYTQAELILAANISDVVHDIMGIPLRGMVGGLHGVKLETQTRHTRLGILRPKGTNVLVEICFVSNAAELSKYHENKGKIAEAIATLLAAS